MQKNRFFWIAAIIGLVIDRITKLWIVKTMTLGQTIVVIPNLLHFVYVINPGAAFGIFSGSPFLRWLSLIASVALMAWAWFGRRFPRWEQWGYGLILSGALGNGIDRLEMLETLAQLNPPPESIPINCLIPISGTPLENAAPIEPLELVRIIATTRILFPRSMVRLSAGRTEMSNELQAMCFFAGANSIFTGAVLLTAPNPERSEDERLLDRLGMIPKPIQGK